MTLTIGGVAIGGNNPCRFVFEVSNAHNGDLTRAKRLIEVAKEVGCDFVKFQAYRPSELVALRGDGPAPEPWGSEGWTMEHLYAKAQTPLEWLPELFAHARRIGIVPFSSVFGLESLAVLEGCECPAYKVARLDNHHSSLIDAVRRTGRPMIISRSRAPFVWGPEWNLWCAPGYPTLPADVQLPWNFDGNYSTDMGGYWLGISSHCMDDRLPIAAVARGAKLIEMHGMLAEEPSELESAVSLNQYQWRQMIADIRAVEAMLA